MGLQLENHAHLYHHATRPSVSRRTSITDSWSTIHMISTSHLPSRPSSCHLPVPATMETMLSLHTGNKPKIFVSSEKYFKMQSQPKNVFLKTVPFKKVTL